MRVRAVVFDVGETLVDETRTWGRWADWLGVPRLTLFAALGAVIARGEHHRRAFELVRPGFDLARARAEREAAGDLDVFGPEDLYPDALPCLRALQAGGLRVAAAGNQPERAEAVLCTLGFHWDLVASSERLRVEKPSPAFFTRLLEALDLPASEVAYVGDRLDNDVLPARAAGLSAFLVRRGPWGVLHAAQPEAARATRILERLDELPALLGLPAR